MTKTIDAAPTTVVAIADPTVGFRRIAGAIALPVAFGLQARHERAVRLGDAQRRR